MFIVWGMFWFDLMKFSFFETIQMIKYHITHCLMSITKFHWNITYKQMIYIKFYLNEIEKYRLQTLDIDTSF